ncbi:MAG: protein kinase domain-containing protein [Gemmataceae bacterium]
MNKSASTCHEETLSIAQLQRLAQLSDEFEALWRKGQRVVVEDILSPLPSNERSLLLPRMMALEFELRVTRGEKPVRQEWLERFPNHADAIRKLFEPEERQRPPAEPVEPTNSGYVDAVESPGRLGRYRVIRPIGEGAFGKVFEAFDDQLRRSVAIKIPKQKWAQRKDFADSYMAEARVLASLDHPNIVPIYDVGQSDGGEILIVSKYIEGSDLSKRLKLGRMATGEAAHIVATIADSLHYAHLRGLVHRDIKPANILIDTAGKPYLADFGLVLRESEFGKGPTFAGTPIYMSPEQARSEGHRVDGRSDIFSLGVVFYELLTGRKPFQGDKGDGLLEQIISQEARPPRQIDDKIPREIERICLKAMAKLANQRYTTAKDMSEDLRVWDVEQRGNIVAEVASRPAVDVPAAVPDSRVAKPGSTSGSSLTRLAAKVVPKGLRSFDAADQDFFVELLPGPRDRDGIPEGLRFWMQRLGQTDAEMTFPVGLIYGPSGCGKSSLVKAGLLPRMPKTISTVYVEAAGQQTETRLLARLQKQFPALRGGLSESIADLRRGLGGEHEKTLIVIDQFEQWLQAHRGTENTELVRAIRQCDGGRVQCLLLIRDDFWMAVTRFMRELEVPIVELENAAAVDLFDTRHAKRVLTMLGRAYGALPETEKLSTEQEKFIELAIMGLEQDGKIIPVRLALFAEMVKTREWKPSTLKAIGGMAGVAVTFLEESISGPSAPPWHRTHAPAARAVLRALLPEPGRTIKGNMRSHQELLQISGYADHPGNFEDLLLILRRELRLVSPSDAEGMELDSAMQNQTAEVNQYFQLTHDYLVPAISEWLAREQKQTRRGRAELLLQERTALWESQPRRQSLPTFWEWVRIRTLTQSHNWSAGQRVMMKRAGRQYNIQTLSIAVLVGVFAGALYWLQGDMMARGLIDKLVSSKPSGLTAIIDDMKSYRYWVNRRLPAAIGNATTTSEKVRLKLASLPSDSSLKGEIFEYMLQAGAEDFKPLCIALQDHWPELNARLEKELTPENPDRSRRFRAACALASFAPKHKEWNTLARPVTESLVVENPLVIHFWEDSLMPVGGDILKPLANMLDNGELENKQRQLISQLYRDFSQHQAGGAKSLVEQFDASRATTLKNGAGAKSQASMAALLASLGRGDKAWPLLVWSKDPTVRSHLIEFLAPAGVPFADVANQVQNPSETSLLRAAILSLGQYDLSSVPYAERKPVADHLLKLFKTHADSGVHGACEWLLRRWGYGDELTTAIKDLASDKIPTDRNWFINKREQTFIIIRGPISLPDYETLDPNRPKRVEYTFAIAAKEVTVAEFERFRPTHFQNRGNMKPTSSQQPATYVSWHMAAQYCNNETVAIGHRESERCYVQTNEGGSNSDMKEATDWQKKKGFRLPTELEWEIACRAGAITDFSCGWAGDSLLANYAYFEFQSSEMPVQFPSITGLRKPNDWGLIDMHGNVKEWCHDEVKEIPELGKAAFEIMGSMRPSRGGAFSSNRGAVEAHFPSFLPAGIPNQENGLRLVMIIDARD